MADEFLELVLLACSIRVALRHVGLALGDRVCVSGSGPLARLTAQLAELCTGVPPTRAGDGPEGGAHDGAPCDLLVDASADPSLWAAVLPRVREQGRVLLLLPPGRQVYPYDFYPMVHRRSLSLLARRVPPEPPAAGIPAGDVYAEDIQAVRHLFERGLLVHPEAG